MSAFAQQIAQLARAVGTNTTVINGNNGSRIAHERAQLVRRAIYNAIETSPGIGATAIANALDITRETASAHLQAMRQAGQIERLPGYYSGWRVCKKI